MLHKLIAFLCKEVITSSFTKICLRLSFETKKNRNVRETKILSKCIIFRPSLSLKVAHEAIYIFN